MVLLTSIITFILCLINITTVNSTNIINNSDETARKAVGWGPTPIIVGGHNLQQNEAPHQVAVGLRIRPQSMLPFCGGCIVSTKTVLTAAHCGIVLLSLTENGKYTGAVAAGSNMLKSDATVLKPVRNTIIHSDWNRTGLNESDIAVLKLSSDFSWATNIQPITIAPEVPDDGTVCIVSGWGLHDEYNPNTQTFALPLKFATTKLLNDDICELLFSHFNNSYHPQTMTCALALEGTPCMGDSGGPFICSGYLTGLVSWGISCERDVNVPCVYTDLFYFKPWVTQYIEEDVVDKHKNCCTQSTINKITLFLMLPLTFIK